MKNTIVAAIFHLLPLIPIVSGYPYAGLAVGLLVGLAYIKVQKLRAEKSEQLRKHGKFDETTSRALGFWEGLTFLRKNS